MNHNALVKRLEDNIHVFGALVKAVHGDDARWRPDSGNWSVLEVVCHLADEEEEDFRVRLESTLRDPKAAWNNLDFDRISERRGYMERRIEDEFGRFSARRNQNIAWLRGFDDLSRLPWMNAYQHPSGPIRAGDLLASWAAHDALHIRQIAKRIYEMACRDGAPYSTAYAGEWKA